MNKEFLDQLVSANNVALSMNEEDRLRLLGESAASGSYISCLLHEYYSSPIMEDGELLKYIENHRVGNIPREGTEGIDWVELLFMMRAYRSAQYKRFMIHILYRYLNKYYPVKGDGVRECCICWRSINETQDGKVDSNTAISSDNTRTSICPHCLMHLLEFSKILEVLGDEEFIKIKSYQYGV